MSCSMSVLMETAQEELTIQLGRPPTNNEVEQWVHSLLVSKIPVHDIEDEYHRN
jgi:hypothetical protein